MNIDDTFHGISTLLVTEFQRKQILGTGFFYEELAPEDHTKKGYYWRAVKETWIVTNRHILLPKVKEKEIIPSSITFHIRKIIEDGIIWEPVSLDVNEFKSRLKLHEDSEVDVAILRVGDLLTERIKKGSKLMSWSAVS